MLKKLAVSIATCCLSTAAYSAGQTCTQTLVGTCIQTCVAQDEYGTCTSWSVTGCHYETVCTTTSLAELLTNSSKICSATVIGKTYDPGNGDQVGNAILALNFPSSFSVTNQNGQILLKNNDQDCK